MTEKSNVISMGPGTLSIPLSLFRDNRQRVCTALRAAVQSTDHTFILLQGGDNISFYDTDTEYVFRQVIVAVLRNLIIIITPIRYLIARTVIINNYRVLINGCCACTSMYIYKR